MSYILTGFGLGQNEEHHHLGKHLWFSGFVQLEGDHKADQELTRGAVCPF